MKNLIIIALAGIIVFYSCTPRMTGIISTSEPFKSESSRRVIDIKNYRIASQNKNDFLLQREEEVEYATTYEEKQRWHNANAYTSYPIIAGLSGWGAYELFKSGGEENLVWGIFLGMLAFGSVVAMFYEPVNTTKIVKKIGNPIIIDENINATQEQFEIKLQNQVRYILTNDAGELSVNPYDYKFPVLTEHQNFEFSFSKDEFENFATANINSSWWMKEYGVINRSPVMILGNLNSSSFPMEGLLGTGSTIFDKQQGYSMLKIENRDAWIKPVDLNIFFYSSQKELNLIPALKSLDYNKSKSEIIEEQKKIIENKVND